MPATPSMPSATVPPPPPPPFANYGILTGQLFLYGQGRTAFESPPPLPPTTTVLPSIVDNDDARVSHSASASAAVDAIDYRPSKLIVIGGLSDGLIPVPYLSELYDKLCGDTGTSISASNADDNDDDNNVENEDNTKSTKTTSSSSLSASNWSIVQPVLSSSYTGFGHGSLQRDCQEIVELLEYLMTYRNGQQFALLGHSTGCQDLVYLWKYLHEQTKKKKNTQQEVPSSSSSSSSSTTAELMSKIRLLVLQAPVSDREHAEMEDSIAAASGGNGNDNDNDNNGGGGGLASKIHHAESLIQSGHGDAMVPRTWFWAPMTAQRFVDLHKKGGTDDFFSSDYTDEEMVGVLSHMSLPPPHEIVQSPDPEDSNAINNVRNSQDDTSSSKLKVLVAYSGEDEYVPDHVNKQRLVRRLVYAMNTHGNVAHGLYLPTGNHNLSKHPTDATMFVDKVVEMVRLVSASGLKDTATATAKMNKIVKSNATWLPLESNPEVFTMFARRVAQLSPEWEFVDVLGISNELLQLVPRPVAAVIMLYPCVDAIYDYRSKQKKEIETSNQRRRQRQQQLKQNQQDQRLHQQGEEFRTITSTQYQVSQQALHMKQVDSFGNACGTIAAMHVLSNLIAVASSSSSYNDNDDDHESRDSVFTRHGIEYPTLGTSSPVATAQRRMSTMNSSIDRGTYLVESTEFHETSDNAATSTVSQTECPKTGDTRLGHHYNAFVPIPICEQSNNTTDTGRSVTFAVHIVEFDGCKLEAIDHGPIRPRGDFLESVVDVCRQKFMSLAPDRIDFSLMALTKTMPKTDKDFEEDNDEANDSGEDNERNDRKRPRPDDDKGDNNDKDIGGGSHHDNKNKDDDDDDDDNDLMDVDIPLVEMSVDGAESEGGMRSNAAKQVQPQAPADDLIWNDNAILECFNVTVATHDIAVGGPSSVNCADGCTSILTNVDRNTLLWAVPSLYRPSDNKKLHNHHMLSLEDQQKIIEAFQNHPPPPQINNIGWLSADN